MSAPAPLRAEELHVLARAVLERVELVALSAELGGPPADRTLASVVASALALHRELARTLDEAPTADGDLIARVSETVERVNDALAAVAR